MAVLTPTRDPDRIVQGATLTWQIYDADYPPDDGWIQKWIIVTVGSQQIVIASDNGDGSHLFTVSSATSAGWPGGNYKWRRVATDGTDIIERASGDLVIEESFLSATGGLDARTDWEQILEDLKASFKEFVATNGGRTQFSIAGRSTVYSTAEEFIKAINAVEHEVYKERRAKARREGRGTGTSIQTRMS